MTCLEAQSKIMAFIENKLPDDELKEFIKHVKNCENCSEELEIYYTLIVGMKKIFPRTSKRNWMISWMKK